LPACGLAGSSRRTRSISSPRGRESGLLEVLAELRDVADHAARQGLVIRLVLELAQNPAAAVRCCGVLAHIYPGQAEDIRAELRTRLRDRSGD
jgi:hypothetical protein